MQMIRSKRDRRSSVRRRRHQRCGNDLAKLWEPYSGHGTCFNSGRSFGRIELCEVALIMDDDRRACDITGCRAPMYLLVKLGVPGSGEIGDENYQVGDGGFLLRTGNTGGFERFL